VTVTTNDGKSKKLSVAFYEGYDNVIEVVMG